MFHVGYAAQVAFFVCSLPELLKRSFFPPSRDLRCMSPAPFSDLGFENGLSRLYFVCTRLYTSFFVCTALTFLPLPGGGGREHAIAPFLILNSKMGSIVCTSFVHDCIRLFSFVQLLLFFLCQGGWGHAIPPFLILDSKMGSIVFTSFVHDYIPLFSFVHLLLFFLPRGGGRGTVWLFSPLSGFGCEKGMACPQPPPGEEEK